MKFNFIQLNSLPKLAWAGLIKRNTETIDLYCGPWIEKGDSDFVEGAWNLPFERKEFEKATVFFGSAGKVLSEKAIFIAPTHTFERLFVVCEKNTVYISNSLPFVLSLSGNELDPSYIPYQADYDSITPGLEKSVKSFH